jgi:hypothetical protein
MNNKIIILLAMTIVIGQGCTNTKKKPFKETVNILFLHHSVGLCIWEGSHNLAGKFIKKFKHSALKDAIATINEKSSLNYAISEQTFPKETPYGWNNFPYDYYNIWVKHAGDIPYMEEPTLEMLTKQYQVIIWKHCFPVSDIQADISPPNIDSPVKRIDNYKLQYLALRDKMQQFPSVKFIVWTGAAQVQNETNEMDAKRARDFFNWVKTDWDVPGDNIYLWDFRELETEGGLYLLDEYAKDKDNSHPNEKFSEQAAKLLAQRIADIIENNGTKTLLTGIYQNN